VFLAVLRVQICQQSTKRQISVHHRLGKSLLAPTFESVSRAPTKAWTTRLNLILDIWSKESSVALTPVSTSMILSLVPELHGS
jgi:hypothetical protein